ncbi:MAG: polysaccharide deacetylase family protein [Chitinophagaceae bacterium]|nr:polysaccharide deacetylase family protein [Chitinophagaceae bacterium]
MLVIYTHTVTSRLQYICSFIFKELLGIDYRFTIDSENFRLTESPKLNYSNSRIAADEFFISSHSILFERQVQQQDTRCFTVNGNKAFFKTDESDFPFDILAASFYLLSRYEEYLPHEKDMYGRYGHENSLAYKEGFLNVPLINTWSKHLGESLLKKFPALNIAPSTFKFIPTYDIDIAFSYKHKGIIRNIGGFFKKPTLERIKVLTGNLKDPFDSYAWLNQLHRQYQLQPLYFFLVAPKNGLYDKNILPRKDVMWRLVKQHAKKYSIGLHPSWQSGDELFLLKKEKQQLEAMVDNMQAVVTKSRQHYIRFNLPDGYQRLIEAGFTDDYSMGFGSINGFRASVAASFYWYNLEKEATTNLRIHPFCFMDANSFYEQKQNTQDTFTELLHYLSICKQVNGTMQTIWHNNFLGTANAFKGWKEMYEQFIVLAQQ